MRKNATVEVASTARGSYTVAELTEFWSDEDKALLRKDDPGAIDDLREEAAIKLDISPARSDFEFHVE